MKTDRSRFQEAHFSTGVFKNPEATNEDVFNIFEKEIQELLQNFKNNESNWRVQRVISPDIHHVESQLFGESSYVWLCWDHKEERQEWRWRILSMVHSQTPQPLSVKPSENLTWKMRWISWISLGLNFQYPWLFWWCDFPTEIKFRWTWEHWTSSSPPTMTGRSINALSNTWPNFFHLKFQVKMVEFASAWDVWIPSEALKQGSNTSKSAKDMSQSRSSSLMMKTWNKKTWTTRCQFYLSVMLISNFPERGLKLEKTNQKRVLQMNMRNTGLQDIASSLQARERKRSLIWSQSWDTKGLKIKILQNNSSFILGKV